MTSLLQKVPAFRLNKWLRYAIRFVLVLTGILLIAWILIYLYFRSHKEEILQKAISLINNNVKGTISIKDIDINFPGTFPYVSVNLEQVSIRDSLYEQHGHELLKAESFLLQSNVFTLLTGKFVISKIQVEHGNIYSYEDSTGYKTSDALSSNKEKKAKSNQQINAIRLVDMIVTVDKPAKRKLYIFLVKNMYCKMAEKGDNLNFRVKADLIVKSLAFNLNKGSFAENQPLTGDFELAYHQPSKTINFDKIELRIGKEPYYFTGTFNLAGEKQYSLNIQAPKAIFQKAALLLPINIRRNIDSISFNKPLSVVADLKGQLLAGIKPVIKVNWIVKDTKINSKFGLFEHTSFDGFFYNAIFDSISHTGENSIIQLNKFSAVWEQIDLKSNKIAVSNLIGPVLNCDIQANADLLRLNDLLGSESLEFKKGKIKVDVVYSGPIYDSATAAPDINGYATIKDAAMVYGPRDIELDKFNGELIFKGTDVYFKNIKTVAQGNDVLINITALNLLTFLNSDPSKAQLDASVFAPVIDIEKFTSFIGTRKRKQRKNPGKAQFSQMAYKLDNLLDKCNIRSDIKAEKISFKKFTATNFKSNVFLSNEVWALQSADFNHAGGSIQLKGAIRGGSKDYNPVNITATMTDVDIAKTFNAFNNFGSSSIHAKNLEGRLSSNINLTAALLEKAELVPSSLKGTISLSLKDGALNNFEPLESMSVFLLKNRDFSHVNFSEIKNTFDFNGRMINVNRMEIQSNVLSLFMEGLYDMGGKKTDLVIQVPLSNLKKRKADYVPENKGVKSNAGASIFVNAKSNEKGDLDFSYSLFNNKKNKKDAIKKQP